MGRCREGGGSNWARSFRKHFLKLFQFMPSRELRERLAALAFRRIGFQHAFEERRHFAERNPREHLLANPRLRAHAAAEDDVVALARADLHALQADVANVMLRARVW